MAAVIEPSPTEWDRFVCAHPCGHALQSSHWGQLKHSVGWQPRMIAVTDGAAICAGALILIRSRFGFRAVYAPRGPLLSGIREVDTALLAAIERMARAARAVFVRIEPNILENQPGARQLHSDLQLGGYQPIEPIQPRSSVHLDLAPEPEQLQAAMSKGHRADIRRAAREGVVVQAKPAAEQIDAFYAILEQTSRRNQFGIHTKQYYQEALAAFGESAQIWIAEQHGEPQATALTLAWGKTACYLYSGSTESGLRTGAQHAIQWEAIRWARARGCATYDFWGVPDTFGIAVQEQDASARAQLEEQAKNDPLYGVYRFKKGFGGQVVRYLPAYDRVLIPPLYRIWRGVS
jgi:serine/alanine adding enzyme